jgi:hypothetical protein
LTKYKKADPKKKEVFENDIEGVQQKLKNFILKFQKKQINTVKGKLIDPQFNMNIFGNFYLEVILTKINEVIKQQFDDKTSFEFNIFTLLKENEVTQIRDTYKFEEKDKIYFIKTVENILEPISNKTVLNILTDLLGHINELVMRKDKVGAFYTPTLLASYLVNQILKEKFEGNKINIHSIMELFNDNLILDPAVGSGNFIILIIKKLNLSISYLSNEKLIKSQLSLIIDSYLNFINKKVFGWDIEDSAIIITKIRIILSIISFFLSLKSSESYFEKIYNIRLDNIIKKDILRDNQIKNLQFSVVVGNPPWGISLKKLKSQIKKNYFVSEKQFDSWAIFLESSIKYLEFNGIIGFIVPSTLLTNPNYTKIREFILKNTIVKEIVNLGEKFFPEINQPAILIILEKSDGKIKFSKISTRIIPEIIEKGIFNLNTMDEKFWESQISFNELLTSYWFNNKNFEFNLLQGNVKQLVDLIEHKKIRLYDIVLNGRGVEIGKKGVVIICPNCKISQPPLHSRKETKKCQKCTEVLNQNLNGREIISNNI